MVHQCRGVRVAQHVGRAFAQRGDERKAVAHDVVDVAARHATAVGARKEGRFGSFLLGFEETTEGYGQLATEGHDALLVAFADDAHLTLREVDMSRFEAREFGHTQACVVEREHYQAVAAAYGRVGELDIVEKPVHIFLAHVLGQRFAHTHVLHPRHRVARA